MRPSAVVSPVVSPRCVRVQLYGQGESKMRLFLRLRPRQNRTVRDARFRVDTSHTSQFTSSEARVGKVEFSQDKAKIKSRSMHVKVKFEYEYRGYERSK